MLPAGVEVSKRVGDVAAHRDHDGPLAAQVLDEDGRQEHGGQDDGRVDDAQRGHAHPCLRIQAALQGERVTGVTGGDVKAGGRGELMILKICSYSHISHIEVTYCIFS